MPSPCFLAADHDALDLAFVRTLAGPAPLRLACYIGAAHGDHRRHGQATVQRLANAFGCVVDAPRLSDDVLDVDAARRAIENAELLFLDGGDTVALVAHAIRHGLDDAFRTARGRARIVAGVSAGACALGPFTIGYAADETPQIAPCFAMGIDAPLDVHSEDDDWAEMRALLELVRDRPELAQRGIVIPTGSALVVMPDGGLVSRGAVSVEVRRLDVTGDWSVRAVGR